MKAQETGETCLNGLNQQKPAHDPDSCVFGMQSCGLVELIFPFDNMGKWLDI